MQPVIGQLVFVEPRVVEGDGLHPSDGSLWIVTKLALGNGVWVKSLASDIPHIWYEGEYICAEEP
jgi:hypothetical protein